MPDNSNHNLTYETLSEKLDALAPVLLPLGAMSRIVACAGLWQQFDTIRSTEGPFDRSRLAHYIEQLQAWSERNDDGSTQNASAARDTRSVEDYTGNLYAQCWVAYDDEQFVYTTTFFEGRLRNNGFGPDLIAGKSCLDAGCGGGRFTLAMHKMGAGHVVGVDLSPDAVADGARRRDGLGISSEAVEFVSNSLLELPPSWSNRYDFVCSNGVLHHTTDPKRALSEVFRVVKPGGDAYIYVYGSGGLHWRLVDWIREILHDIDEAEVRDVLHLLDLPPGKIFHIMDHWFVPNYETLTRVEYEDRLNEAGFTDLTYMPRGMFLYDSSERLYRYPEDADLMGDGDLRYMVHKPAGGS